MSKRLQVVLSDAELRAYQKIAREKGIPLSEWVREVLRRARRTDAVGPADRKLAAIRAAARHDFPAPDIDDMLAEIERGYHEDAGG
jgi:hypothetical protein